MLRLEVILLTALVASCQGFWWSSKTLNRQQSIESDEPQTANAAASTVKQIPVGYFRSVSYQPLVAYPSLPFYPRYYNPLLHWPQPDLLPALGAHQAMYAPIGPSKATQTSLGLQAFLNSIKVPSPDPINSTPLNTVTSTIRSTTTTEPPTTTTTTTKTALPTTTTTSSTTTPPPPPQSSTSSTTSTSTPIVPSFAYNDLPTAMDSVASHSSQQQSAPIPALITNRRNGIPLVSRPYQQPLSDSLAQRYLADYLADNSGRPMQQIQFVPCMCPISLALPVTQSIMQPIPDDILATQRSDGFNEETLDESIDNMGLDDDQSTTDKNLF